MGQSSTKTMPKSVRDVMRILGGDASRFKSEKKRERARELRIGAVHTRRTIARSSAQKKKGMLMGRGQSQGFIGTSGTSLVASLNHRRISKEILSPQLYVIEERAPVRAK